MGALGVVRGNGDLDLALTIRTFAVAEGRIHLWVGGGIVWDSEPEAEIEESWTKARPLLAAVGAPGRGGSAVTLLALAVGGRGVVDPAEPVLRADDEALLRGRAAFETIRVYGGRPFKLAQHLDRLAGSAERIGLPAVNRLELEELAAAGARRGRRARRRAAPLLDADAASRWRSSSELADHYEDAARARPAADLAARRARRRAVAPAGRQVDELRGQHGGRGRGEAAGRRRRRLRRRRRDVVLEGPTTNIWWRRERTLYTPSLDLGILAGVTRATVLELAGEPRLRASRRATSA